MNVKPLKEVLTKIFKEERKILIIDRNNDTSFPVLFGVHLCNRTPLTPNDTYGRHVLLERFYKDSKVPENVKVKKFVVDASHIESAYNYYHLMGKSMLEFVYRYGYHNEFKQEDGKISIELVAVETDDYYDVYAYYAYNTTNE